jgi:putative transposase
MQIFQAEEDFDAFRRVVEETLRIAPIRICVYCWMPNHWHFVLWPRGDGDLSKFMQRMANMHTQRWQRAKLRVGHGHLYQGRFKSFPIETDEHFYSVVRYVERNALRAGLVDRAEDWRWASLHQRTRQRHGPLLADWPLPRPSDWTEYVNLPQTEPEVEAIHRCIRRGTPYGNPAWIDQTANQLGL